MTLAQVQAAAAVLVALVFTLTGLLTAVALLLPRHTERAAAALDARPWRCFWAGLASLLALAVGAVLAGAPNPLAKLLGAAVLGTGGAVVTLGLAGTAHVIGGRIAQRSSEPLGFGTLARASLVYSLAALFPVVGWWVFAPLTALCALGAGVLAVRPERRAVAAPPVVAAPAAGGTGAP